MRCSIPAAMPHGYLHLSITHSRPRTQRLLGPSADANKRVAWPRQESLWILDSQQLVGTVRPALRSGYPALAGAAANESLRALDRSTHPAIGPFTEFIRCSLSVEWFRKSVLCSHIFMCTRLHLFYLSIDLCDPSSASHNKT